jgi:hypothetical protein
MVKRRQIMKDLRTIQSLQEFADLLVIPPDPSYIPLKKRKVTKVEVYPRNYIPANRTGIVNEKVELVIPLGADIGGLFGFTTAIEKELSDYDGQVTIRSIRRFCARGTVITMEIRDIELSNIIVKLANMSQVETAEEKPLTITLLPLASFPNNLGGQLTSGVRPNKKIQVILRETNMVRQEAAAMLN